MIVEDKAAEVAWHLLCRYMSFKDFKRELRKQRIPAWNRAVALVADAMREYAEEYGQRKRDSEWPEEEVEA